MIAQRGREGWVSNIQAHKVVFFFIKQGEPKVTAREGVDGEGGKLFHRG